MKRLFPILLALVLAFSGCGGKEAPSAPAPETSAPAAEPSAPELPPSRPDKPEEWPLADDALVREMVKIFGAEELSGPDGWRVAGMELLF